MSKFMKLLFLVESGLVITFVGVSGTAFNWYQNAHARGGGGEYPILSRFAVEIDVLFACIIGIFLVVVSHFVKRPKEQAAPKLWPLRLGMIFALVSFFSCLGFVIARMFQVDLYAHLFLIYLSLPGLGFGILATIVGLIGYKNEHSRIALAVVIVGLVPTLVILFMNQNGAPFACFNNKACAVNGLDECYSYSGQYAGYEKNTMTPGVCAVGIPGYRLCGGTACRAD